MAVLRKHAPTGEMEFKVPFDGAVPGAPLRTGGTLVLRTEGPDAKPVSLQLRLFPTAAAFMAKLPALVKGTAYADDMFALGRAATTARPALVYEARPEVLGRVPAGIDGLAALEAFIRTGPQIFDFAGYDLAAVSFTQEA